MDNKIVDFNEIKFEKVVKDWLLEYDKEGCYDWKQFLEEKLFEADLTKNEVKLLYKHAETTSIIYSDCYNDSFEEKFKDYEKEQIKFLRKIRYSLINDLPLKLSIKEFQLSFDSFHIGANMCKDSTVGDYYKKKEMLRLYDLNPTLTEKEFSDSLVAFKKIIIKCRVFHRNINKSILPLYL